MTFNSIDFALFFLVVLGACRLWPGGRVLILLVASLVFYSWLSWWFGAILLAMSVCGYVAPIAMQRVAPIAGRRLILAIAIALILVPLFVLKYWDFLARSAEGLLSALGWAIAIVRINQPLPPGISFHTFQLISYAVDVFRKTFPVEHRLGIFFLFSSYFPQLVAGPIERPSHLIPQLPGRSIDREDAEAAYQYFLYGLFLKTAIADVVGVKVDGIYLAYASASGAELFVATALFYVQIYCDFAGYSLMAIGVGRALGVNLVRNFERPMIAMSPVEFWHRWHISLSQWFRDYVYIPLGGSRGTTTRWVFAVLATFLLSGLWHGANWTFVVWGFVHGIALVVAVMIARVTPRVLANAIPVRAFAWLGTQLFVILTWTLFRAPNIYEAGDILARIAREFVIDGTGWGAIMQPSDILRVPPFVIAGGVLIWCWVVCLDTIVARTGNAPLFGRSLTPARLANECAMLMAIGFAASFAPVTGRPFIYFQF
jgi:alginate O-acetyltransferase complex protein AlgI